MLLLLLELVVVQGITGLQFSHFPTSAGRPDRFQQQQSARPPGSREGGAEPEKALQALLNSGDFKLEGGNDVSNRGSKVQTPSIVGSNKSIRTGSRSRSTLKDEPERSRNVVTHARHENDIAQGRSRIRDSNVERKGFDRSRIDEKELNTQRRIVSHQPAPKEQDNRQRENKKGQKFSRNKSISIEREIPVPRRFQQNARKVNEEKIIEDKLSIRNKQTNGARNKSRKIVAPRAGTNLSKNELSLSKNEIPKQEIDSSRQRIKSRERNDNVQVRSRNGNIPTRNNDSIPPKAETRNESLKERERVRVRTSHQISRLYVDQVENTNEVADSLQKDSQVNPLSRDRNFPNVPKQRGIDNGAEKIRAGQLKNRIEDRENFASSPDFSLSLKKSRGRGRVKSNIEVPVLQQNKDEFKQDRSEIYRESNLNNRVNNLRSRTIQEQVSSRNILKARDRHDMNSNRKGGLQSADKAIEDRTQIPQPRLKVNAVQTQTERVVEGQPLISNKIEDFVRVQPKSKELKKISNENIEKRINKGRGRTNYSQKKTVNNSITSLSETVQSVPVPRKRGRTQLPGRKAASQEIPNQTLGVTQRKNTFRIKVPQVEGNKDHDDKSTKQQVVKSLISSNQGDNDGRLRSRDPARSFLGKAATRVPEVVTESIGAKDFKVVQDVNNNNTFFIGNSQEVIGSKTNRVTTNNYQDYAVVNRERISPKTVQENQISIKRPESLEPVQHKAAFEKEKKIYQDNEDSDNLKYVENSNDDYDYDYVEFESANKKRVKPVIDALSPDVTTTTTISSISTKSPRLNNENKSSVTTSTQGAQVNKNFRKDFEFEFDNTEKKKEDSEKQSRNNINSPTDVAIDDTKQTQQSQQLVTEPIQSVSVVSPGIPFYDLEKALQHAKLTWEADPFRKLAFSGQPNFDIDYSKNTANKQQKENKQTLKTDVTNEDTRIKQRNSGRRRPKERNEQVTRARPLPDTLVHNDPAPDDLELVSIEELTWTPALLRSKIRNQELSPRA